MGEQTPEKLNQENKEETVLLPQNEENNKMSCISISGWIFQIIIWIGGICLLYIDTYREKRDSFSGRKSLSIGFIIALNFECFFYIIYVIFQFHSDTFAYLRHKKNDVNLYNKMKQLFTTPPKIKFVCECYHYETRTYTSYDSDGNESSSTITEKVVTKEEFKFFEYYSSRDVSGLFNLNYDESSVIDKCFIKLKLSTQIDFADALTYNDYQREYDELYQRNVGFDVFTSINVQNIIEGFESFNMINITGNNPCGINIFWFIIFNFMGIAQLYKIYINSKCLHKSFTIRKLISSRFNLKTEECGIKYKKFNPVISFDEEKMKINVNEIGYLSEDFNLQLPTQEEIESAQKYQDKVFNIYNEEMNLNKETEEYSMKENDTPGYNNNLTIELINK